jgi:hypothetical protein
MLAGRPMSQASAPPPPSPGNPGNRDNPTSLRPAAPRGGVALISFGIGIALALVFLVAVYPPPPELWARLDFNAAPFEDFIGPYFAMARALPGADVPVAGYHYPAFFALLLAPLAALGPLAASWGWLLLEVLATALLVALPLRYAPASGRGELVGYGLLAGLSHPLAHNLYWGQVSTPIALALLVAVFARRRAVEDVWIAAAAAVKLVPALFWLAPLAAGDSRRVVRGAALAAAFVAVPAVLLMGPRDAWTFHAEVVERLLALGAAVVDPEAGRGSQDLGAAFGRWAQALGADGRAGFVVGRLVGVLLAALLVWRAAREDVAGVRFAALSSLAPLLVAPIWSHGLVFVPAAAWFVWRDAAGRPVVRGLALLAAIAASSLVHAPMPDAAAHARAGFGAAAVLLLSGAVLLGTGAAPSRHAGRPSDSA